PGCNINRPPVCRTRAEPLYGHQSELYPRCPYAELVTIEPAQMLEIEELLLHGQLALAEPTVLEVDGHLHHLRTAALDHQLEPDFVADRAEVGPLLESRSSQRKETGHRIAHVGQRARQQGRRAAVDPTQEAPVVGRAASDISRANNEVRSVLESSQHLRQRLGGMA